ncbi:FIG00776878: hypothetical protein [hydrothermal vent metagenome]|uniref:DUF1638 domain-containing protein n=1 Tax=hydrothermal vent metagenome TaxID=652676 RepID=A0A3B0R7C1_9ZZZZ
MNGFPSDQYLTENGLDAGAPTGSILLIACGALAHEILALIRANGWTHMVLSCLPAKYHLYPDKITRAVAKAVENNRDDYDEIFVVYADCGTGGLLQAKCAELGVKMVEGPHCYSFFEGNEAFENRADAGEITAFYLTDFLVKQFDAFVWKPMGLDKHPELRNMLFGNYTKLVYQAQTNNADLIVKAKECAIRLGLDFEYRYTGYGELETALRGVVQKS